MTPTPTLEELNRRVDSGLAALAESAEAVDKANEQHAALSGKIDEIKKTLPSGHARARLDALLAQRKNLRASVAMGEADQSKLASLEQTIIEAEALEKQEAGKRLAIEETLSALEKRLVEAKKVADQAQADRKKNSVAVLGHMVDSATLAFKESADKLIDDYRRLRILGLQLNAHDNGNIELGYLTIPCPLNDLMPRRVSLRQDSDKYFYYSPDYDAQIEQLNTVIKESLMSKGVILAG